ncbi:unnamed protein product, partial [Scytosiphon promiscuus]
KVSDRAELKRTPYFPGLGWLFPRKLFDELRPRWPSDHWDHWLRDPKQHKGRESIFPEVTFPVCSSLQCTPTTYTRKASCCGHAAPA